MGTIIKHTGIVIATGRASLTVRLGAEAEHCNACALSAMCSKPQTVEVAWAHPSPDLIGRCVTVSFSQGTQRRAVTLFLAVPVGLLLGSVLLCLLLSASEGATALIAMGAVACWFAILYICKGAINRKEEVRIINIE